MSEVEVVHTHQATDQDPQRTECWVIESHRAPVVRYWAGYYFVPDFETAVRFCRQTDAQAVREQFSPNKAYKCVKHVWL